MLITGKMVYLQHVDYEQDGLPPICWLRTGWFTSNMLIVDKMVYFQHVDYEQDGLPPICWLRTRWFTSNLLITGKMTCTSNLIMTISMTQYIRPDNDIYDDILTTCG